MGAIPGFVETKVLFRCLSKKEHDAVQPTGREPVIPVAHLVVLGGSPSLDVFGDRGDDCAEMIRP